MSRHEVFQFKSLEELQAKIHELGVDVPLSEDRSIMAEPVQIGPFVAPNRYAILPMEGCDSEADGSPSELVKRRYHRFAEGGAGLVWWEACAVVPEGRANLRQMMLTDENKAEFKALFDEVNDSAEAKNGYRPVNILQLTHSGRYSAKPLIVQHDPILDPRVKVTEDDPVLTDEYLASLVEHYVHSARLAKEIGFEGVDIKACHRYLLSELLAAHTREGQYGGSFENRTRLMLDIVRAVKEEVGDDYIVASRFNVYDAHPYPYGFGCDKEDFNVFDPEEPMRLVKLLIENGVNLLSNSAGNPYYIYPQVTRPFDQSSTGIPIPDEHQLESIERLLDFTTRIQEAAGDIPVIGNGYSWLRQFFSYVGAATVQRGAAQMIGIGRQAFAYPDAPRDLLTGEGQDPRKQCIACSKCTQIMRDGGKTGCVVRDAKIYAPLYKEAREAALQREAEASK